MYRYALRIFRQSLPDWMPAIGVVSCVCTLIGICVDSFTYTLGLRRAARLSGDVNEMHAGVMTYYAFIALLTFYALTVIGVAVADRMRLTFGLWRLVGATPSQIRSAAASMVVMVALLGALPGALLAIPATRLLWPYLNALGMRVAPAMSIGSALNMVASSVAIGVLTCCLGVVPTARRASRSSPVEVFRRHDAQPTAVPRHRVLGWTLFALALLMAGIAVTFGDGCIWGARLRSRLNDLETSVGAYTTLSLYAGLLMVAAVYFLSPRITSSLLRALAGMFAGIGLAVVSYALRSANAHISANATFVSALSSGIGCAGVLLIGTRSGEAVMRMSGTQVSFDYSSTYLIAGLTMFVLLLAAIATLMLSGGDERREQATLRVAGMSPADVIGFRAMQSVMLVMVSLVVSVIPMTITVVAWAAGANAILGRTVYAFPWIELLVAFVVFSVVIFAVQWLRLRPTLRRDVADALREA